VKRALVGLVVAACGGDDGGGGGEPVSPAEAASLCEAFSAHATSCGWGGNVNRYDWNCGDATIVWRDDAMREFAECATNLECAGDGASCYTRTTTALTPLDYHSSYASRCQARMIECDLGTTTCSEDRWELYTRAIVTQLTACYDRPCAEITACISAAL
jgi:hypothetical protein